MESEQAVFDDGRVWNRDFICVMTANFMLCIGHFSVNPLVASYTVFLGASPQLMGILTGMFYGVAFAMRPFAGPATTKLDKRRLMVAVFILGAFANLGYALLQNVPAFVFFRFLSGVQYSIVGSLLMTLAGDHLPKSKLTYGMGVFGVSGAISVAFAPWIGETVLTFGTDVRGEGFGFMLVFLLGTASFIIAVIPSLILSPDGRTKEDYASTGSWYKNIFTIHAVPVTIVLFFAVIPHAMINTYVYELGKEQSIEGISAFYLVFALTMAVSRPLSGYLTYKLGVEKVVVPALAVFALALFVIGSSGSLSMIILGAVLSAIGVGSSLPSLQAMCLQTETPLRRGVASNTIYIGFDLGLFIGPMAGGFVYAASDYSIMFKAGATPAVIAMITFLAFLPVFRRRLKALETKNN